MISIIIPHRGNDLGLWATVTSCENELLNSGIEVEYIFITNGDKELNSDSKAVIEHVRLAGKLKHHEHFVEGLTPPDARQIGSTYATGEYLFFFDNHCMVTKDYFKRAIHDFTTYDIDLLHSTTQYYVDDPKCYHYNLKLKYNFWGAANAKPRQEMKPYQIAVGGHGGFAVKRSSWEKWLNLVFESFCDGSKHTRFSTGPELTDMFDLYAIALDRTKEYRKEIVSKSSKTLDELLTWFREQDIAY